MNSEDLIDKYSRMIAAMVKRFEGRGSSSAALRQAGEQALLQAAASFTGEESGFPRYAEWAVRQGILRALIEQSANERISVEMAGRINRLRRAIRTLREKSGRQPTLEELAAQMQISPDELTEFLKNLPAGILHDAV